MKRFYRISLLAALLAAPAPALAQAGQQTPAEPSREAVRERMARGSIQRLLEKRAELGLSAQQVTRLEGISARLEQRNRPLLEQLRAARPFNGQRPRDLTQEQREAAREKMEQLRPVMQQVRENHRTAMQEAREVLTAEQQQKVREQVRERRAELRRDHPRGRRQGAPGQPERQGPRR